MDEKRKTILLLGGLLVLLLVLLAYGAYNAIPQFDGKSLADAIQITLGNTPCCEPEPIPDDPASPAGAFFFTLIILVNVLALMYVTYRIGRIDQRDQLSRLGY